MKKFTDLIRECLESGVKELFPWDLEEYLPAHPDTLLLDIREPYEYEAMHMEGSLNVPRGILETACEFNYDETVPELADARARPVVVICRSGNRSILAAHVMSLMGYREVYSLKTGLKGWNEYDRPLVDAGGRVVDIDRADEYFAAHLREDQIRH